VAARFKACIVEDCKGNAHSDVNGARGMCVRHYCRFKRHGSAGTRLRPANGEAIAFYRDVVLAYDGDDCLIWPFSTSGGGYGNLTLENGRQGNVHLFLCEEIYGPAPSNRHQAAHSCGRGKGGCVAKRHLSWKTIEENHADKIGHGTTNRGERNGQNKLSSDEVLAIRAMEGRARQYDIAAEYGVSPTLVSRILARKAWGWL
jgi:hypothetical protein